MIDGHAYIERRIAPLYDRLRAHRVYALLGDDGAVRTFMEHHVFAVWDFMSLLKGLQREVTCVGVPWLPTRYPGTLQRFVTELCLGEECDDVPGLEPMSHFELYRDAMKALGASTLSIDRFVAHLASGGSVGVALEEAPVGARHFVMQTFDLVHRNDAAEMAGAFAYGREEIIPAMFRAVLDRGAMSELLALYLTRHVELDAGEHGTLARALVAQVCGDDEAAWSRARRAAVESLTHRIVLWDCVADALAF